MNSKYGFYKIASGNFITHVGEVNKNKEEIISLINEAKEKNINVLSFSELSFIRNFKNSPFFNDSGYRRNILIPR